MPGKSDAKPRIGPNPGMKMGPAATAKVSVTERGKKKFVIAPSLIKRRKEESAPFPMKPEAAAAR